MGPFANATYALHQTRRSGRRYLFAVCCVCKQYSRDSIWGCGLVPRCQNREYARHELITSALAKMPVQKLWLCQQPPAQFSVIGVSSITKGRRGRLGVAVPGAILLGGAETAATTVLLSAPW